MIYLKHSKIWINEKKINYIKHNETTAWCEGAYVIHFNRNLVNVNLLDEDTLMINDLIKIQ